MTVTNNIVDRGRTEVRGLLLRPSVETGEWDRESLRVTFESSTATGRRRDGTGGSWTSRQMTGVSCRVPEPRLFHSLPDSPARTRGSGGGWKTSHTPARSTAPSVTSSSGLPP